VRHGLGGTAGTGRQYISWIHEDDFIRAVYWLIEHDEVKDAVNVAAPNPVPNRDFMRALRQAWGIRFGLPATKWMLELGALFMKVKPNLCSRAAVSCLESL
jgi:NAD dependent epimerase/dehydratase family enzyme